MNINLTLFVQAFNFLIAYQLITRLFLKPAFDVVVKENSEQEKIEKDVVREKNRLMQKKEEKQAMWRSCQAYCNQHKPQVDEQTLEVRYTQITGKRHEPTQKEIEMLTNELAEILKTKVIKHG